MEMEIKLRSAPGLIIQSGARFNELQLKHVMNSNRNRSPLVIVALIGVSVFALVAGNLPARAAEKDAAAKDLDKLQGEWVMISGLADGGAVPEDMLRTSSR